MQTPIRCIAIDDEPIALDIIRSHAEKVPFITLEATFASATEGLYYVQNQKVGIIFLDIDMPDISGIEFAKLVGTYAKIIFTTAYSEFAVLGFELAATDYVLKPINFTRFLQACTRVLEQHKLSKDAVDSGLDNFLFVKDGYNLIRINLDELLYIKADDNYLTFYETHRRTVARMTLAEAAERLANKPFLRVSKSFVVGLAKVEKMSRHQLTVAGLQIPVSEHYRAELLQRLDAHFT